LSLQRSAFIVQSSVVHSLRPCWTDLLSILSSFYRLRGDAVTTRNSSKLAEALESCRPVPPDKPNILKTLLAVQSALGHVPTSGIPQIAQVLGVTDAQVAGVLSYYSDLRTQSAGRHLIRVCMGESCTANYGGRVLRAIQDHVRVAARGTTPDARFTVEQMSCAGNCAVSPTVMIDEDPHGRVAPSDVPSLLEPYR
jgi:NADH:ubiquinone oxidoreductase subunit E